MRVSILGAGNWGKNLVRVFCQLLGSQNTIVCDPDADRLQAVVEAHPGIKTSPNPTFEGVDAVVVATPAATHYSLAREALLEGKHVLVEKPLTLTTKEAKDLVALANDRDLVLMVDHLLLYHPAIQKLKELVVQGWLGQLRYLWSQRLNLGVVRTEENALWSLAPHDISVMLFLLEQEPLEIDARGQSFLQPEVEDVVFLTLGFPSGAIGHVHVSWLDPVKTRKLIVVGDQAMVVFDDLAPQKLVLLKNRVVRKAGGFQIFRDEGNPVPFNQIEPLQAMARAFCDSVLKGLPSNSEGTEAIRVIRILETAQQKLQERGAA